MRILIRVDGDRRIGGGHVMRCLTLADALAQTGHLVDFAMADAPDGLSDKVRNAGHGLHLLPLGDVAPAAHPPHAGWLRLPPARDGDLTGTITVKIGADWLVWDHYGLDADWVARVRTAKPDLRVLALDDLDDRALASDLLLDQTRLSGAMAHAAPVGLHGPAYALLRPEFAALREASLARRSDPVQRVLITPGMMDAVGLAPLVLDALESMPGLDAEVVMSSASQSVGAVRARLRTGVTLVLDATDMATRMAAADLCVGAGGMTSWERCCLGLPAVTVAVADNQRDPIAGLSEMEAIVPLTMAQARDAAVLRAAIFKAVKQAQPLSKAAASLCDGRGAERVAQAMSGHLRPLNENDRQMMFGWRNLPHIVAVTASQARIEPDGHQDWLAREMARDDAIWRVWHENGRDLGICGASAGPDGWAWSFYIGAENAPRGAGNRMCGAFLRELAETPRIETVNAIVRVENKTSIRLHQRLGFAQIPSDDPMVLAFAVRTWDVKHRLRLPNERTAG